MSSNILKLGIPKGSLEEATVWSCPVKVDTKKVMNIIIFGGVLYGKEAQAIYERV